MQRQRRRDTAPELAIRRILHARGMRFFVDRKVLPELRTRADMVFPRWHLAIFIDGCFWHGCPDHGTTPKSNQAWWRAKLAGTAARDRKVDDSLRSSGWRVIRVWEHENPGAAAERIAAAVSELGIRHETQRAPRHTEKDRIGSRSEPQAEPLPDRHT
jgi:DNA mismatch endonuclease (patch repair protein)